MANRRKQDDRNLEILRELIAAGENRYCFDCGTRGPTYVNTTIGSFVCSKCSGMLRGLTPPHRVKSISMATFTSEEMDLIKTRGNKYCRQIWLSLYEGKNTHPKDEQGVRDFMIDKYERKRYYLNPESVATLRSLQDVQEEVSTVPAAPLISIAPQVTKPTTQVARPPANNMLPPVNSTNFVPRPTNNIVQPSLNNNNHTQLPVPEFTVDFSTANIYNSSEHNKPNNDNMPQINNNFTFNAFCSPPPPTNDRYAALADLDIELRQQKCLNSAPQENGNNNINPFESTSSDLFGNKNPFSNGFTWNSEPAPLPFNPFTPSTTINGFGTSKNPFL